MHTIIVGCGRVGAGLAEALSRSGQDVTVIDVSAQSFNRLNTDFPGQAVRGDGTDEDVLRRLGAESADYFFALTEGDNRNALAAQIARDSLHVPHVVAKINESKLNRPVIILTMNKLRMKIKPVLIDTSRLHTVKLKLVL